MAGSGSNDGVLIVQLAQWSAMSGVQDALGSIFAEDFDPDTADANDDAVRKVLYWGETIGTLTKNNLISRELILDWIWVAGLWARVGKAAIAQREKFSEPKLYENFEALAGQQSG